MLRSRKNSFHKINNLDVYGNMRRLTIDANNSTAINLKQKTRSVKKSKHKLSIYADRDIKQIKNKLPSIFSNQSIILKKILMKIQDNIFFKENIEDLKQYPHQQFKLTYYQHKCIISKILEKKYKILEENSTKLQQNNQLEIQVKQHNQINQKISQKIDQCDFLVKTKQLNYALLVQRNKKLKQLANKLLHKSSNRNQLQKEYMALRKQVFHNQQNFHEKISKIFTLAKFQFHKISLNTKKQPQIFQMPIYNDEYHKLSYVRKTSVPQLISCYLQIMKLIFSMLIQKKNNIYQIAKLRELLYLPIITIYAKVSEKFIEMQQIQNNKKQSESLFMQQQLFWKKQTKQLQDIYQQTKLLGVILNKKSSTQRAHKAYEIRDQIQDMIKLVDSLQDQYKKQIKDIVE